MGEKYAFRKPAPCWHIFVEQWTLIMLLLYFQANFLFIIMPHGVGGWKVKFLIDMISGGN